MSARLTVLAVTLAGEAWGAEQSLLNLAPELRELGVDLVLACPAGGELERRWVAAGLVHRDLQVPPRLGVRGPDGRRTPWRELLGQVPRAVATVRRLRRLAREADVVHSNALLTHLDCVAAARLAGRPVLLELHDDVPPGAGRVLLSAAVLAASGAVAVSGVVRRQLLLPARRRTSVLGQGVDLARFTTGGPDPELRARLTADPDALLVGVVGRLDPEKRVERVVEALAAVRAGGVDAHLVVVGAPALDDGGYADGVRRAAEQLLPGAHRFTGAVQDVPAVMRCLDVFVNAREREPFGLVALEAQACGVPVVLSRESGGADLVRDGVSGLLFDPARPESLAEALGELLEDPAARRRVAAAALAALGSDRTTASRARALAGTYRSLAGRPAAPGEAL